MSAALSSKWLKAAQSQVNTDPAFRALGSVDTDMALKVGQTAYLVTFSGFSCYGVRKISSNELREADFVVEMSPKGWEIFVEGRRSGEGPSLAELDVTNDVVRVEDPRQKLEFLRYHLSVQAFIDAGARAA